MVVQRPLHSLVPPMTLHMLWPLCDHGPISSALSVNFTVLPLEKCYNSSVAKILRRSHRKLRGSLVVKKGEILFLS